MTIIKSDDIRYGKPVIEGSRVAVEDVVETFYSAGRSVEQISKDYGLTEEQVEEALRFDREQGEQEVTA